MSVEGWREGGGLKGKKTYKKIFIRLMEPSYISFHKMDVWEATSRGGEAASLHKYDKR